MRAGWLRATTAALFILTPGAASAAALPGTRSAADRVAWRSILHWPASCESGWREAAQAGSGVGLLPAGADRRLVAVDCYFGAYQGVTMLYLVGMTRSVVGPLPLQLYGDPGSGRPRATRQSQILGVLSFASDSLTLHVWDKFSGAGDCGIYSTFRLAGSRFVPVAVRAKLACNGKPPLQPGRWPQLPLPADP
jgi:hypothetical protein